MILTKTSYDISCSNCNFHWAFCNCEKPNLVNKYNNNIKFKTKVKLKLMKLIQWFKDFNVDKEEKDTFLKAIKDRYAEYFYNTSANTIAYQFDLQYNLFKTQQEVEKLKNEIKVIKKRMKWN